MTKPVTLEELQEWEMEWAENGGSPYSPFWEITNSYRLALAVVEAAREVLEAPPRMTSDAIKSRGALYRALAAFDKGTPNAEED